MSRPVTGSTDSNNFCRNTSVPTQDRPSQKRKLIPNVNENSRSGCLSAYVDACSLFRVCSGLSQTQAVMSVIIAHSTYQTGGKEPGSHRHVCPSSFNLAPAALSRYLRSSPVDWALHTAHASSSLTSLRGTRSHIVESTTRVLRPAGRVSSTAKPTKICFVIVSGSGVAQRCYCCTK